MKFVFFLFFLFFFNFKLLHVICLPLLVPRFNYAIGIMGGSITLELIFQNSMENKDKFKGVCMYVSSMLHSIFELIRTQELVNVCACLNDDACLILV